jgi:hypothetical protein
MFSVICSEPVSGAVSEPLPDTVSAPSRGSGDLSVTVSFAIVVPPDR